MAGWIRGWRLVGAVLGGIALLAVAAWTTAADDVVVARGEVMWDPIGETVIRAGWLQTQPRLVSDGASGALVVWQTERLDGLVLDIAAQRVLSDGAQAWPWPGVALSEHHGGGWADLVEDGTGGAIVTWSDPRDGAQNVYGQRVLSDGTQVWAAGGVSVCVATNHQYITAIVPDGAGGAIMAWYDYRGGGVADVYAQRVLPDGASAWAVDGVPICTATGDQKEPHMASDGAGGAIMAWTDSRDSDGDIYAQRVLPDGTAAWATDGVALCTASGEQRNPIALDDGTGGAIVVWVDGRAGAGNTDLYAQRVLSDGTAAWATDGVALTQASGYQWKPAVASDGASGAIVAWQDRRSGSSVSQMRIYAQRVLSDGAVAWATDGVTVSPEGVREWGPDIMADGEGGSFVTWPALKTVEVQRLRADGTARWTSAAVACGDTMRNPLKQDTRLVSDGTGGVVVVWADNRHWYKNDDYDIYAQRVREVSYRYYFPAFRWDQTAGGSSGTIG